MTRSTQRDEIGVYLTGEGIYGDWGVPEKYRGDNVDRLAAYEDTGLDPEEIEQLKRERDAAIENLSENLRIAYKQRDAAIKDLEEIMFCGGRNIDTCDYCKNAKCYGRGGRDLCDPEWRGIQKEER